MFKLLFFVIFFIKTAAQSSCPNGSYIWQNNCYTFNSKSTGFADAESQCIQNEGHLTSIHDGFTNAWISQEASNQFHESTVTDFWIGATDLIHPQNWSWTDGTLMDFSETSSNSTILSGSDCISVTMSNGKWQPDDCFKTKPYVCKLEKNVYPAFENCPEPLIYYQPTHSCYGDGTERKFKNWSSSEDYCISIGGHLPSIHSHAEEVFLEALLMISATNFWAGAYSNDNGVTWKWSDNSPWDYNAWSSGFPMHNASGCTVFWGGGVADKDCNETRTLICQVKLKSPLKI